MAKKKSENDLKSLEILTESIINKFEESLTKSKVSELDDIVNLVNDGLEKQRNLINKISNADSDRADIINKTYDNINKLSQIFEHNRDVYDNILSLSLNFEGSWDNILNKTKSTRSEYEQIVETQKKSLTELDKLFNKEKKIQKNRLETFKKIDQMRKSINRASKTVRNQSDTFFIPQFANPQTILEKQIKIEKLSGGKPYLASHPDLGVPLGLFNSKDEPNKQARIRAIKKHGQLGSLSEIQNSIYPQYLEKATKIEGSGMDALSFITGKAIIKATSKLGWDVIIDITQSINQFGDKLQEYAGSADESLRSTLQVAGVLKKSNWKEMFDVNDKPLTKAAYFADVVTSLNKEIANEGIFFNIEAITELQKQFTQINQSNILLGKKDLKTLAYIQITFNLAANDVTEMQSAFMDLGLNIDDVSEYTNNLTKSSLKYGVNAGKLIKESGKYLRLASIYRFKGGVKDMQKMQVYAANSRFDIENAYNVMDKALSIEGAIDLASQLQVLGGQFANITGADLFAMAMGGDSEAFIKQIVDAFKKDVGRFGQYTEGRGFEFTGQGRLLLDSFKKIDGFDLGDDLENIITKAGKEQAVREKIMKGNQADQFKRLSLEQQEQIISHIAQGSVEKLNLTGLDYADEIMKIQKQIFSESDAFKGINEETAKATMSGKKRAELNKHLVALQSETVDVFDEVNTGLKKLDGYLKIAGETIYNVGIETFTEPFFKQIEVLTDYLGLSTAEALMVRTLLETATIDDNTLASGLKGLAEQMIKYFNKFTNGVSQADQQASKQRYDAARKSVMEDNYISPGESSYMNLQGNTRNTQGVDLTYSTLNKRFGGILKAKGGLAMGPSHDNGGIRGTGMFNNVEVEGGEAIINKNTTRAFLPLLSKLNELGGGKSFGKFNNVSPLSDEIINLKINGRIEHVGTEKKIKGNIQNRLLAQIVASQESGETFDGSY